ncbi:hypothetical protein P691DRAFT_831909 [Macrolepiota fuliginosa MF-IS2]|uniref:DUF6534 domain-containing protein n=1 Tax=Macrolepiota fuliginosa MF-IS2 TaxID=1400762 RepID=A0A9P5XJM6_9AGAR|nr:hypothetical protein P691DRAFT_831909 [Macrolepiota fuliginosa MF-IS2]
MSSVIPLDLSSTLGAWLIGAIISVGFLGITTLQSWIYYSKFPRDPPLLKIFVLALWCLEFVRTSICIHGAYYYTIPHWGDVRALLSPVWSMLAMVLLTAMVELLAHWFFAHQIWSITRGKYRVLFYVIVAFSIGDFGLGVAAYIAAKLDGTFQGIIFGMPSHIATAALACAIIADWTITGSLVMFLRKNKTTNLTDLVVLIMANIKWPTLNLYQVSLYQIIGNFYINTVLASLNSRTLVAEHLHRREEHNIHFTSYDASLPAASTHIGFNVNVEVSTTVSRSPTNRLSDGTQGDITAQGDLGLESDSIRRMNSEKHDISMIV